jgi:hypothetical protein
MSETPEPTSYRVWVQNPGGVYGLENLPVEMWDGWVPLEQISAALGPDWPTVPMTFATHDSITVNTRRPRYARRRSVRAATLRAVRRGMR